MNRRALLGSALVVPVQSMVGKTPKVWHAPSYVRHLGTRAMSLNIYDAPYGARGDGVTDNGLPILHALSDAAGPAAHGYPINVDQPPGLWMTSKQIAIPSKVVYRGSGLGSILHTLPNFPVNTALIRLGLGGQGVAGCRIETMVVDCGSVLGSVGVYSNEVSEQCGLAGVSVVDFMSYGVHVEQNGRGGSCSDWLLFDLSVNCSALAIGTDGIRIENSAIPGYSMSGKLSRISVVPFGGAAQQAHGVHLFGTTPLAGRYVQGKLDDIHVENAIDGVFFDHEALGHVLGIETTGGVQNSVRINNDSAWAALPNWHVKVEDAWNVDGGPAVLDVLNGVTTRSRIAEYNTPGSVA